LATILPFFNCTVTAFYFGLALQDAANDMSDGEFLTIGCWRNSDPNAAINNCLLAK
jgi:hypothetical protein